ncbi:metal-dependent transcriptional regulator [Serinibacter arcticus]|uniref:Iron-dependent repressor IdeR/DtxR n=1 Tax=Serinibacter arcticus TaxID=1655435 RepID=A0A4Z1DY76_9MICO|nr:metal-dependent transcriptional regulator [Serinibacter arcticus]TGO03788.1 Iron-dependent repressor IdeR/DtxR [Serinibacter arcticus]
MSDLIDTTEMYLKTIYELLEEGITPLRARIAERLGHSGPTVSQTVARMERDGLVVVTDDRHLELTPLGYERAMHVMRKHRLAERLLVDVIGLDWAHVHEEACRWEHVMSEQVEARLLTLLDHPTHDPYGNPIPGLDELGDITAEPFLSGVGSIVQAVTSGRSEVEIKRIGEPLQVDVELLRRFEEASVRPGTTVAVTREGSTLTLRAAGSDVVLDLPTELAKHVFVAA